MDKIKSIVTGDAYDKPAKTADGAMTTQDSSDAHTLKGTSADPNPPEPGKSKIEQAGDKAQALGDKAQEKTGQAKEKKQEAEQKADKHTS